MGKLFTKIYDNRNDFNFTFVNFPFLSSNTRVSPAYGVYVSQLIRYARASSKYEDFLIRGNVLTRKLINQGYLKSKLISTM